MLYYVRFSLKAMMPFARAVVPKSGIFTCSLQMTSVIGTDAKSSKSSRITKTLSRFLLSLKIPSSFHHCRSGLLYGQSSSGGCCGVFYGKNYEVLHGSSAPTPPRRPKSCIPVHRPLQAVCHRSQPTPRLWRIPLRKRQRGRASFVLGHAFVFESRRPASYWPCSQAEF